MTIDRIQLRPSPVKRIRPCILATCLGKPLFGISLNFSGNCHLPADVQHNRHVTGLQQRNPCVGPAGLREDVLLSPSGDVISWLGARETMSPQPSREICAFVDGPHPENCPQRRPPIANCVGCVDGSVVECQPRCTGQTPCQTIQYWSAVIVSCC